MAAHKSSSAVTKEPATGIEFPGSLTAPGSRKELSLAGAGVREKKIAIIKVKVYAVGFYIDASALAHSSLSAWKGKPGSQLAKDEAFFKALIDTPVERALKMVLARDVEGAQFWGAMSEALAPKMKTAGTPGQQALASLGSVFKGVTLKQGTTVLLVAPQPGTLQVAIYSLAVPPTPDSTIESAALVSALFDNFLGKNTVSPTATAAIANNFPSLL